MLVKWVPVGRLHGVCVSRPRARPGSMSWFMGDSKARNEEVSGCSGPSLPPVPSPNPPSQVDGLMRSLESVALERDDALRLISHWTKVPVPTRASSHSKQQSPSPPPPARPSASLPPSPLPPPRRQVMEGLVGKDDTMVYGVKRLHDHLITDQQWMPLVSQLQAVVQGILNLIQPMGSKWAFCRCPSRGAVACVVESLDVWCRSGGRWRRASCVLDVCCRRGGLVVPSPQGLCVLLPVGFHPQELQRTCSCTKQLPRTAF